MKILTNYSLHMRTFLQANNENYNIVNKHISITW